MAVAVIVAVAAAVLLLVPSEAADVSQLLVRGPVGVAAPLGDEVSFTCVLRSPAEKIRWKHDGSFIQQQEGAAHADVRGGKGNRSSLHLTLTSPRQAGDYQCVAWFGVAALTSRPARLSLVELHPFPRPVPPPGAAAQRHGEDVIVTYSVAAGNTVVLRCDPPYSEPRAKVHFLRDSAPVPLPATPATEAGLLALAAVAPSSAGLYSCEASNSLQRLSVRSRRLVRLQVLRDAPPQPPSFLEAPPTRYTVPRGGNVTLECAAVGSPPPSTVWELVGGEMDPGRVTQVPGGLLLTSADPGDEGSYRCLQENSHGSSQLLIALTVHEPPELVRPPPEILRVLEGDDAVVECVFKGKPQPNVTWVFNGDPVANDSHVTVLGGRLQLKQATRRHAGIFQCFASNELGSTFGLTTLQVALHQVEGNEEPAPPQGQLNSGRPLLVAPLPAAQQVPGDWGKRQGARKERRPHHAKMTPPSRPLVTQLSASSVMVRWKVPPNDGLPIQFFKVQYSVQGGRGGQGAHSWMTTNEDVPPHVTSYALDGLRLNHTYKFRIAAAYSNDDNKLSPNSAKFHLRPEDEDSRPPAPHLFRTEAVAPTAIRIFWQYDDSAEVRPEGFYVYYRLATTAGDYLHATVERHQRRSFDLEHLLPDTVYEVKLQAFTLTAASHFSDILTQKTLPLPTTEAPAATTDPSAPQVHPSPLDGGASGGSSGSAAGTQLLYLAVGCGVGVLALLVLAAATCWLLYQRHRHNAAAAPRRNNTQGVDRQDKDPSLQIEAVSSLTRGKSPPRLLQQNGGGQPNHTQQNGKVNITSNPLAEVESQGLLETPHGQNNNCERRQQGGGGDTTTTTEAAPACWRQQQQAASNAAAGACQENYV